MSFLDTILETKRMEVHQLRDSRETLPLADRTVPIRSLRHALLEAKTLGLIAEIKRKSPSKGVIQADVNPAMRAQIYAQAGATGISVLTDATYFGGSIADLSAVRAVVDIPVLRKDFIIDEIQIDEAYAAGADVVLLIAAALTPARLQALSAYAQSLGMDVLLEVHEPSELDAAMAAAPSVLGVNNRNLHTFEVDLATTETILQLVPSDTVVISESGIFGPRDAERMSHAGAQGILVGELLMRHANFADVANCVRELQVNVSEAAKR